MSKFLHLNNYIALLAESHLLRKLNLQDIYRSDIKSTKYNEYLLIEVEIIKNIVIQITTLFTAFISIMAILIIII